VAAATDRGSPALCASVLRLGSGSLSKHRKLESVNASRRDAIVLTRSSQLVFEGRRWRHLRGRYRPRIALRLGDLN
jgi:hypothetical protein